MWFPHRCLAQPELPRDLFRGPALRQQAEHVELPRRQPGCAWHDPPSALPAAGWSVDDPQGVFVLNREGVDGDALRPWSLATSSSCGSTGHP